MDEPNYSCFLHPRIRSQDHPDICPECGKSYTAPLDEPPKSIKGMNVIKSLDRGFYGVTYLVKNPITQGLFTMKVIPKKTYSKEEGYNKDFNQEIQNHKKASDKEMTVPKLIDAGECELEISDYTINCYFMQLEYIEGVSLEEFKNSGVISATRISQVAYDLFEFLWQLEKEMLHHNDLHSRNIVIKTDSVEFGRINALDKTIRTYVIDLGSVSDKNRSGCEHYRDITWIVQHVGDMIFTYLKRNDIPDKELRVLSRLNSLVQHCLGEEYIREITPEDYCNQIRDIVKQGENPWAQPKELVTPGDHYNAQTMPTYYASHLFCDPENKWFNNLIKPGPILLTGMRGCGKTILLKSVHFLARAQKCEGEDTEKFLKRLENEKHVAFFVSCSALLTDPKSKKLHFPNHKLILAFSLDFIRCVRFCELEKIGEINYKQLEHLCNTLKLLIPWFEKPSNINDTNAIERSIEKAILRARSIKDNEASELNVHKDFDRLASIIQSSIDIWNNKHILFLLDDVSDRYLRQDNVDEVLSQLCHQASRFSFKISTETPSLRLRTGGGEFSRLDRDYEEFDLGNEVMQELKHSNSTFVEDMLRKRLDITPQYKGLSPKYILDQQPLIEVARNLVTRSGKRRGSYWGINVLGTLSTGDIGDSILMFHRMLQKMTPTDNSVSREDQDSVIFDFSERKLRKLAIQDKWLYDHAIAFAQASQLELRKSYSPERGKQQRIRQYNEVFLKVDPEGADDIFDKINRLVEMGIFIYAGGTPRSKGPKQKASLYLKLAYRKILGVTNLMPISFMDRFEISGDNLISWLNNPTANKLRKTVGAKQIEMDKVTLKVIEETDWIEQDEKIIIEHKLVMDKSTQSRLLLYNKPEETASMIKCKLPFTIETETLRSLKKTDIKNKHIIGALGFEDRSIGTWKNILSIDKPSGVTFIGYKIKGFSDEICDLLEKESIPFDIVNYDDIFCFKENEIDKEKIKNFVKELPTNDIILDVTSLTKPLIFLLTFEILRRNGRLNVIHTLADEYLPNSNEVSEVLSLLEEEDAPIFFKKADELIPGEYPEERITIWQNRDPCSNVYLICFISLKYSRVQKLLEELPVDCLDIIYPLSLDGKDSAKSKFAEEIANTFVHETGNIWATGSNDHVEAFQKLKELYTKYALEAGNNVEIGLTGVKIHMVAAGMLASIANISGVYYTPASFDPEKYTKGTGKTNFTTIEINKYNPY